MSTFLVSHDDIANTNTIMQYKYMPIDAIVNFFDTLLIPIVVEVESFRFRSLIDPACIIAIAEHIYSSLSMTDIILLNC